MFALFAKDAGQVCMHVIFFSYTDSISVSLHQISKKLHTFRTQSLQSPLIAFAVMHSLAEMRRKLNFKSSLFQLISPVVSEEIDNVEPIWTLKETAQL